MSCVHDRTYFFFQKEYRGSENGALNGGPDKLGRAKPASDYLIISTGNQYNNELIVDDVLDDFFAFLIAGVIMKTLSYILDYITRIRLLIITFT